MFVMFENNAPMNVLRIFVRELKNDEQILSYFSVFFKYIPDNIFYPPDLFEFYVMPTSEMRENQCIMNKFPVSKTFSAADFCD